MQHDNMAYLFTSDIPKGKAFLGEFWTDGTELKENTEVTCVLYVSNMFHARYRRIEYALKAFGSRFRHASMR